MSPWKLPVTWWSRAHERPPAKPRRTAQARGELVAPLRGAPGSIDPKWRWTHAGKAARSWPARRGGAQAWKACWIACWISLARNGPAARPSGPQATPLRGALRVHTLSTPTGFAWKIAPRFSTPPLAKSQSAAALAIKFDIGYGCASLAAPLTPLDGTQASRGTSRPCLASPGGFWALRPDHPIGRSNTYSKKLIYINDLPA